MGGPKINPARSLLFLQRSRDDEAPGPIHDSVNENSLRNQSVCRRLPSAIAAQSRSGVAGMSTWRMR